MAINKEELIQLFDGVYHSMHYDISRKFIDAYVYNYSLLGRTINIDEAKTNFILLMANNISQKELSFYDLKVKEWDSRLKTQEQQNYAFILDSQFQEDHLAIRDLLCIALIIDNLDLFDYYNYINIEINDIRTLLFDVLIGDEIIDSFILDDIFYYLDERNDVNETFNNWM